MVRKSTLLISFLVVTLGSFSQEAIKSIKIGDQVWMADNLNVDHYVNGDSIPQVQDPVEWSKLKTGAWCYYENNTAHGKVYGKLYNAYAVLDPRGLAPDGWHLPTEKEWQKTIAFLGGEEDAGAKMKSTTGCQANKSTDYIKKTNGNNSSGFNGLPNGMRKKDGSFEMLAYTGGWWLSPPEWMAERNSFIDYYQVRCTGNDIRLMSHPKVGGLAVRCIKD